MRSVLCDPSLATVIVEHKYKNIQVDDHRDRYVTVPRQYNSAALCMNLGCLFSKFEVTRMQLEQMFPGEDGKTLIEHLVEGALPRPEHVKLLWTRTNPRTG